MKKRILLLLFLTLPVSYSISQVKFAFKDVNVRSYVSLSLIGPLFPGTIGYGQFVQLNDHHLLSANIQAIYYKGPQAGISISDLIGKGKNHLVLGIGYNVGKTKFSDNYDYFSGRLLVDPVETPIKYAFPYFNLGYARLDPQKRWTFSVLLHPEYFYVNQNYYLPVWGSFSIGYQLSSTERKSDDSFMNVENKGTINLLLGVETEVGYGNVELTFIGKRKGFSVHNRLVAKFLIGNFYMKGFVGNSILTYNQIDSKYYGATTIFESFPSFLNFGMGVGLRVLSAGKWNLDAGISTSQYYTKNRYMFKNKSEIFSNSSKLVLYSEPIRYNLINYPLFSFSPEITVARNILKRADLIFLLKWSNNHYFTESEDAFYSLLRYYSSSLRLLSREIGIGVGFHYHIISK